MALKNTFKPLKLLVAGLLVLLGAPGLQAQDLPEIRLAPIQKARSINTLEVKDSVRVYFRVGKSAFDENFENNGENLRAVGTRMREVQRNERMRIDRIFILASASPEGAVATNERLASERSKSIEQFLHQNYNFASEIVEVRYNTLDWRRLRALVEADANIPNYDKVKQIVEDEDFGALRRLQGTAAWNYMLKNIYPSLRNTFVVFEYTVMLPEPEPEPEPQPELAVPEPIEEAPVLEEVPVQEEPHGYDVQSTYEEEEFVAREYKIRESYLKVNALTLPLLVPNFGFEYLFLNNWSASALFYYTALDWFDSEAKFRVLGLQAELRYWFLDDMMGPFVAAHATFGYYNIAWGGDYRYQDHNRSNPTFGGGVNLGYKIPLFGKEDTPWGVEFTLGAGVLPLHYDIYYNVKNGRLAGEDKTTYFGIDNASVTVTYRIGRKIKERRARK